MTETYKVDLKCCNCKKQNWNIEIPTGVTIKEFGKVKNKNCSYCDCHIIKRKEKKE